MPRITKVTTRLGDAGETSLGSRARVPKDTPRRDTRIPQMPSER
jgi:cob(I)alamin adenosyltransferase